MTRWVALMPLRGGSKSIPGKNLRDLAGRPLFAWALEQAVESGCFEQIFVATDSGAIRAAVSELFPGTVAFAERSPESATDEAPTETVMLEVQRQVPFDVLALVQATSPLTRAEDFREARRLFERGNYDSLVTVAGYRRFLWSRDGQPLNYDPRRRPRRQDFEGMLVENGAFYFTRAGVLTRWRCRLGERIAVYRMAPETLLEVDEPADWEQAEALLAQRRPVLVRNRPDGASTWKYLD